MTALETNETATIEETVEQADSQIGVGLTSQQPEMALIAPRMETPPIKKESPAKTEQKQDKTPIIESDQYSEPDGTISDDETIQAQAEIAAVVEDIPKPRVQAAAKPFSMGNRGPSKPAFFMKKK